MVQMVQDISHLHEVHKKAAEVLEQIGTLPLTPEGLKSLNTHLRKLNAFFDQMYVKAPDFDCSPPSLPIVEHAEFGSSQSYRAEGIKEYFDSTVSRIHDVIENLPTVNRIYDVIENLPYLR